MMVHDYIPHHHNCNPGNNNCSEHCCNADMEAPLQQTDQPSSADQNPWSENNCCELVNITVIISESSTLAFRLLKLKADHSHFTHGLFLSNRHKKSPAVHLSLPVNFLLHPPLAQKPVRYIYFSDQSPPPQKIAARA
jgi:hypothetical protein